MLGPVHGSGFNVPIEKAYSARDAMRAQADEALIRRRKWRVRLLVTLPLLLLGSLLALVAGSNLWVSGSTYEDIHETAATVPFQQCALVLGTSKRVRGGNDNPHFMNRLEAAAELYKEGRVTHILVSGDNGTEFYNEPRDMKAGLIERGIPSEDITCDFAGFRTLDSIVRAREVFQLESFVIVTDDFHVARALFLARAKGIQAVGYSSGEVPSEFSGRSRFREKLARVKAVLDVYLFHTGPKFLGDPEPIFEADADADAGPDAAAVSGSAAETLDGKAESGGPSTDGPLPATKSE